MKPPVAVTEVVLLKDLRHDHVYFCILITQALAGFVLKITAACKLQNAKQLSKWILFLKGINYPGFLPVLQGQKADARVFLSVHSLLSVCLVRAVTDEPAA